MKALPIGKLTAHGPITVEAPASKSLLNRALMLAAFSEKETTLVCGGLGGDTRAMLSCLTALGIETSETEEGICVKGCGGDVPVKNARLDVRSAGTAARFLSVALALFGGSYTMTASAQMSARPMDILPTLEAAGVRFEWLGETGRFPFRMFSDGIAQTGFTVNTDTSTQYASALLLAAPFRRVPTVLELTGSRTRGSYIRMTEELLSRFGVSFEREGDQITVFPHCNAPSRFEVEADVSGACYFFALALLCRAKALVKRIGKNSLQGDMKFLSLLEEKGVVFTQTDEGLLADGSAVSSYTGFDADMGDFSDQTLTAAALAPFASTPTHLKNIAHIRRQECDRIRAITENLQTLGVPVRSDGGSVTIFPAPVSGGTVKTFGDHRVAMSFALVGLKTGNVLIDDPSCCEKTFETYFEILKRITT